jgi:hypothetical protein
MAHLYFFFNSVGLKGGLLYTNLLTPFFIWSLYKHRRLTPFFKWGGWLLLYMGIQYWYGVELKSFLISGGLLLSTALFVMSAQHYISCYPHLKQVMHQILLFNFILLIIAIPFYFMEYNYQKWFWYSNLFTTQKTFTRLALFTFEASYYSLLLIPLCYYYYFKVMTSLSFISGRYILLMTTLPLLLSMSFGVLGGTLITAVILCIVNRKALLKHKLTFQLLILGLVIIVLTFFILFTVFSEALFVKRIGNIFSGIDTSTNGRTIESFQIVWLTLQQKSIWWGCGPGQLKHLIPEIIQTHFAHWGKVEVYRIPNTVAETLGVFGIIGLAFRFVVLGYLFFKTRVSTNHYRLALFIFMFVYQFTGSYITNIVEYVIWIFAFTNVFPEFDKKKELQQ